MHKVSTQVDRSQTAMESVFYANVQLWERIHEAAQKRMTPNVPDLRQLRLALFRESRDSERSSQIALLLGELNPRANYAYAEKAWKELTSWMQEMSIDSQERARRAGLVSEDTVSSPAAAEPVEAPSADIFTQPEPASSPPQPPVRPNIPARPESASRGEAQGVRLNPDVLAPLLQAIQQSQIPDLQSLRTLRHELFRVTGNSARSAEIAKYLHERTDTLTQLNRTIAWKALQLWIADADLDHDPVVASPPSTAAPDMTEYAHAPDKAEKIALEEAQEMGLSPDVLAPLFQAIQQSQIPDLQSLRALRHELFRVTGDSARSVEIAKYLHERTDTLTQLNRAIAWKALQLWITNADAGLDHDQVVTSPPGTAAPDMSEHAHAPDEAEEIGPSAPLDTLVDHFVETAYQVRTILGLLEQDAVGALHKQIQNINRALEKTEQKLLDAISSDDVVAQEAVAERLPKLLNWAKQIEFRASFMQKGASRDIPSESRDPASRESTEVNAARKAPPTAVKVEETISHTATPIAMVPSGRPITITVTAVPAGWSTYQPGMGNPLMGVMPSALPPIPPFHF